MKNLSEILGPSRLDHAAYKVRHRMMTEAIEFFDQLGWLTLLRQGTPGREKAVVCSPLDLMPLVLTEDVIERVDLEMSPYYSLSLRYNEKSAGEVAQIIRGWTVRSGLGETVTLRSLPDGSWEVWIPEIFPFPIVIVSPKK